jgi:Holliday junction resolvase RusA-like endonuclease
MICKLEVHPQTHVRTTQDDAIVFRIPEKKLRLPGLKRKMRIEGYNLYKKKLCAVAAQCGFSLREEYYRVPESMYLQVKFFVPVPKSWRLKKKIAMHLKKKESTPDFDNFSKALCDALLPGDDSFIADIRITKLWFYDAQQHTPELLKEKSYQPSGYIEFWMRPDW